MPSHTDLDSPSKMDPKPFTPSKFGYVTKNQIQLRLTFTIGPANFRICGQMNGV